MAWVKLDDQFADHPKVIRAGEAAAWLFVSGLCYCSKHLTDGFIPAEAVRRLATKAVALAGRLVEVGLWERAEGGYRVHDYLDWNPTGDRVRSRRAAIRERVQGWREKRCSNTVTDSVGNSVTDVVGNDVTNADVTASHAPPQARGPSPSPSPDQKKPLSRATPADAGDRADRPLDPEAAFVAAWVEVTDGKAWGNPEDNAAAWKLIAEQARLRSLDPHRLARDVLLAHLADLGEAREARKHHGAPTVAEFVHGPRGTGGWFNRALARLEAPAKPPLRPPDARPNLPAERAEPPPDFRQLVQKLAASATLTEVPDAPGAPKEPP